MDDDAIWLRRWREGDQKAGRQLFDRHFSCLYRYFANKVRTPTDADDLVQRSFEIVLRVEERFEERSSVGTFILGVAHNVLQKYYVSLGKDRFTGVDSELSIADLGAGPHTQVECAERDRVLHDALRQIPAPQQEALELFYFEGRACDSIAEILDVNRNTARRLLQKGRQSLEAKLRELAGASPPAAPGEAGADGAFPWERELSSMYGSSQQD